LSARRNVVAGAADAINLPGERLQLLRRIVRRRGAENIFDCAQDVRQLKSRRPVGGLVLQGRQIVRGKRMPASVTGAERKERKIRELILTATEQCVANLFLHQQ